MATASQQQAGFYPQIVARGVVGAADHDGTMTDIFAPKGSPVDAATGGVVIQSARSYFGSVGLAWRDDQGHVWEYRHVTGTVPVGTRIRAGQAVATIGDDSLPASYGHVDVRRDGQGMMQQLQQLGARFTKLPGRTPGPNEIMQGIPGPLASQGAAQGIGAELGGALGTAGGLTNADLTGLGGLPGGGPVGTGAGDLLGDTSGGAAPATAPAAVAFANPFADLGSGFQDFPKWALAAAGVGVVIFAVEQGAPREAGVLAGITLLGVVMLNPKIQEQLTALTSGRFGQLGAEKLSAALATAPAARSTVQAPGATGSPLSANATPSSPLSGSGIFGATPARISFPYGGTPYSFGGRTSHGGVDLQASSGNTIGQPFYFPEGFGEGRVVAILPEGGGAGTSNSGGQGLIVQLGGGLTGLFAHFYHVGTANVRNGDTISPGQALGTVGLAAPGDSHLHVELRDRVGVGGRTYDPTSYLQGVLR